MNQSTASVISQPGLLSRTEERRLCAAGLLDRTRRSRLGQFFTPSLVAASIAEMVSINAQGAIRLLDPGAGVGNLTAALVERLVRQGEPAARSLHLVAYEIDANLHPLLRETLEDCVLWAKQHGAIATWEIRGRDYINDTAAACSNQIGSTHELFDAVIMNPPYRKINVSSPERKAMDSIGLRVTNLYTAFLALAVTQLRSGGVLAAITPRSFANGLYHEPLRRFVFSRVGIERLHVFESRGTVFADADVLQENVIFAARRDAHPSIVSLSISNGSEDLPSVRSVPYGQVIDPDDAHQFMHIPTDIDAVRIAQAMASLPSTLQGLGLAVSTGRVVDFRAREYLRPQPEPGAVPLIYPTHLQSGQTAWPANGGGRKPNALRRAAATEKLLLPNENYVLVKRFSAKEERKRVSAAICSPAFVPGDTVAFENHLNVFHDNGHGLPEDVAAGLAAYLNSTFVDRYVRLFNGHTQINATDLRKLRYPPHDQLCRLAGALRHTNSQSQEAIDAAVEQMLSALPSATASTGEQDLQLSGAHA